MNRDNLPSRMTVIGVVFFAAILAFEVFNFDTTRFALNHLMRNQAFNRAGGVSWAAALAIAFCGIDFAGLIHIFTSHSDRNSTPTHIWYLMGAWLLGATLNAIMTWYAVSITLVAAPATNTIFSQEEMLKIVPIFVAFLVWLTRIMFIAALALMGATLLPFLHPELRHEASPATSATTRRPVRVRPRPPVRDTSVEDEPPVRTHSRPPSPNGQL